METADILSINRTGYLAGIWSLTQQTVTFYLESSSNENQAEIMSFFVVLILS